MYVNGVCRAWNRKGRKLLGARKCRIGTKLFLVNMEKGQPLLLALLIRERKHLSSSTLPDSEIVRLETAVLFANSRVLSQK